MEWTGKVEVGTLFKETDELLRVKKKP